MVPAGPRRRAVIAASGAILAGCTSRSAPAARVPGFFTSLHGPPSRWIAIARIAPGAQAPGRGGQYTEGIAALDTLAGGDFTTAPRPPGQPDPRPSRR